MSTADGKTTMTKLQSREFCDTMSQFCTGLAIVAGAWDWGMVGFTAQPFVSLSLPQIAVRPGKASTSWPRIRDAGRLGGRSERHLSWISG